jgi:hypothetical protein
VETGSSLRSHTGHLRNCMKFKEYMGFEVTFSPTSLRKSGENIIKFYSFIYTREILSRKSTEVASILCRFCVDSLSILRRFSVDLLSVFCRSSVDFGRNWPKPSLSGVVNPGLQIAFQKRGQKRPKIVLKQGPQRVCTIHPDLPAGTPCYNFTGPTRNTV